jgi:hypothetical protein
MEKISHLEDLRSEQLRLVHRRYELEHHIRRDWEDLRHHFQGTSFARGALLSGINWLGRRLFKPEPRHRGGEHLHSS